MANSNINPFSLMTKALRQELGNTADQLGTALKFPIDTGVSEIIAGGPTTNTGTKYGRYAYEPVTAPVDTTVDNRNPFLEQGLLDPLNINTTSNNNSSGSTQQTKQPTTTNNFDPMNRNIDPGPGYFWDAADGWKPVGGGSSYDAERARRDAERARREQEARDNISRGFDQYERNLQGLIPTYQDQMNTALGSAEAQYQNIFGGLQQQKQSSLDKLQGQAGQVKTMAANSIEDLKRNLNQTVRGMGMQLGAMGAGDTSATQVMMPYAYAKLAGVQEGGIQRQQNDQLFQISQAEQETENQFNTLWGQTETEKINSLQNIRDTYGGYINNVRNAIANAPVERAQALQGLLEGLLTEASNKLTALESQDRQYKASLQDWAMGRMSELNNMKLEIANSANFNPLDIYFNELQMANAAGGMSSNQDQWNNPQFLLAMGKNKRDSFLND